MDLHYSQTVSGVSLKDLLFHYLMDLHYSQTILKLKRILTGFTTLWIYTILKLNHKTVCVRYSFTTLWIYTILKRIPLPALR